MCGRYGMFSTFAEIANRFRINTPNFELQPRYNAAPTQMLPVIVNERSERALKLMRWGLTPSWAGSLKFGNKLINARAETLQEKPSFRTLLKTNRIIIPVNGFYEWRTIGKEKRPMFIQSISEEMLALAGLWDRWKSSQGEVYDTFTIITTNANDLISQVHERMPVIIPYKYIDKWLSNEYTLIEHIRMLVPYASSEMKFKPASKLISDPNIDVPELLDPNFTGFADALPSSFHTLFE